MRKATVEFDMEVSKPKSLGLRFAAYLCSALALLNPVAPALANVLEDAIIEQDLNENPLYLKATGGDYQFNAPQFIEWPSSGTKSLESVYQQLLQEHSSAISPPTYVPIGVGGITTFIPTYTRYKYVGTPAVQARYVRTQIVSLLGRNIFKYASEAEQLNALYSNAVSYAKDHGVRYGVPLFLDQNSSELERDMIWPELREINGQAVIVPVVYLTSDTVSKYKVVETDQQIPKTTRFGSLTVYNSDLKTERDTFLEVAGNLNVLNGSITGDGALKILALGSFDNASSSVTADQRLEIGAKSIVNRTIVYRYDLGHEQGTRYGEIASVSSAAGDLILMSHSDIQFHGASASAPNGELTLAANGHILVKAQPLYSGSTSRYGNGTQTRSQVSYLQSHLTAEDTLKLIASGQIVIEAAELASDSGHIELLGGMGVSVLDAQGVTQFQASGKFGKTSVNESAYLTVAMRAVLDAGKGIRIHSDIGDITLRATEISSVDGTSISASNGQVNLLVSTVNDQYNYQSVRKGSLTVKTRNRGHNIATGIPNTIVGGLSVEAVAGLNIQYTADGDKSFEEQLQDFEKMPELKWIADLKGRTDLDINWSEIEQQYETWNKSNTSLSPAAIAIIAIVVVVATGGAAAALGQTAAGALSGTAATTVSAAVTAGVTAMATQVAVITANSFVNGEYNPYEIQKDIHTEETLATVATAMVTAAALSYLDTAFFEDLDVDALAKQQGVDPSTIDTGWLRDAQGQLNFVGQAAQATTNAATSAFIDVLARGESLSDFGSSFESQFKASLVQHAVDSIGKTMSEKIGQAYKDNDINNLTRYIAHAGAGCLLGVGKGDENTESEESNCLSGAGGAVVGELVSDVYKEAQTTAFFNDEQARVQEMRDLGFSDSDIANYLMSPEMEAYYYVKFDEMKASGVDLAKLSGAFAALVAGGDVNIAAATAENASANNAFFLIPLGIMALKAIDVALTAGDLWKIYLMYQSGNVVGASAELAKFAGEGLAGKVIPGFRTAEEMLSYLRKNGVLSEGMVNSIKKIFDGNKTEIDQRNIPSIDYGNKVVKDVSAGSKGSWDKTVNGKLEADTVYRLDNGHVYVTDPSGRVTNVGGQVGGIKLDRNSYQQRCVGHEGSGCSTSYDGGHLIATHLGGAGDKINLVPMSRDLNRIDYRAMEIELGKQLDAGKAVSLKIDVAYPNSSSSTPSMIEVTAWIDGVEKVYNFKQ